MEISFRTRIEYQISRKEWLTGHLINLSSYLKMCTIKPLWNKYMKGKEKMKRQPGRDTEHKLDEFSNKA
jgi:hypothetical protein